MALFWPILRTHGGVDDMGDKAWKQEERRVAALFNTTRLPLSGNSTANIGSGDIRSDKICVEVKSWARMPLIKHIEKVRKEAKEKPWVLAIHLKGSHNRYGVVDLEWLANLYKKDIEVI